MSGPEGLHRAARAAAALLAGLATGLAAPARAAPPTPDHAAFCAAALKARADPLVARVRERDAAAEAQLVPIVTVTFAFVGTVYKQGLRQPQADELLHRAEVAQARVPPEELARRQDACHAEGRQLLQEASVVERELVEFAARRRVARLHTRS